MPRDIPIGNGNVLISFDKEYRLREFSYPYVGQENHTRGEPFRFGVWVDGQFSWIPDGWALKMDYLDDSLVTNVVLENASQKLRIVANDLVDFNENLYLKKLTVENFGDKKREVRLFLGQDFHIYGTDEGDTAEYRPEISGLLHYKHERYFLANIFANQKFGIDLYAIGKKETGTSIGTWKDAEDGVLGGNPIAQGSVDSVIGIPLTLDPGEKEICYYWIAAGKNWDEVKVTNDLIKKKTPEAILKRTFDYWHLWVNKEPEMLKQLPEKISRLYRRSLLICRTQINNCGSIIAANDSNVLLYNRDTYSYMWPRDGALVANALDLAGYELTQAFYSFCGKIIEKEGYFLHKYTPSGSLASSWHPWIKGGHEQLPIQEDETALVIWALWKHFEIFRNVEFIKGLYKPLIKRAADFMMNYRDLKTFLPLESYDLWEERQGVLTFTVATVYGGLLAAANFTESFGETELAQEYREGAAQIREAMDKYLYLPKEKRFARMINFNKDGTVEVDSTIDVSLCAVFAFGAYEAQDEKVKNTMEQIKSSLWNQHGGGLVRYEKDSYYRKSIDDPSNPWFVATLWLAQYYVALARNKEELKPALDLLDWVANHALPSGVLAEQIDHHSGEPVSVSPLTWSHASYITTVQQVLSKLKSF